MSVNAERINLDHANKKIMSLTRVSRITVPDGTVLLKINAPTVCRNCGAIAMQEMSYVFCETTKGQYADRDYGYSIKHHGTSCAYCGDYQAG